MSRSTGLIARVPILETGTLQCRPPSGWEDGSGGVRDGRPNNIVNTAMSLSNRSEEHLSAIRYRPDIDGLRAVAVLSVVFFHAYPDLLPGGFVGVDVFFVISGFLISKLILQDLEKGDFSYTDFLARRIRRIFPALLVVLLTTLLLGWWILFADDFQQLGKHVAAGAGFVSNFALWAETGYFDTSAITKPLLHLWSLGIEEQFYLVWPLALWLIWKRRIAPLGAMGAALTLSFVLAVVELDPTSAFYNPLARFWELIAGAVLAWLVTRRPSGSLFSRPGMAHLATIGGCLLLASGLWLTQETNGFPRSWALLPVMGTVMVIGAGQNAWINRVILSHKAVIWFGLISFPLYLWHWPLLTLARLGSVDPLGAGLRAVLVGLSVALAWLTYRYVELPVRFGKRHQRRVRSMVGLMVVVFMLGCITYVSGGWNRRAVLTHYAPLVSPEARAKEANLLSSFRNYQGDDAVTSTKPLILIMGDSHLRAWSVGLSAHIDRQRYDILSVAYVGCDVVPEGQSLRVLVTDPARSEGCDALEEALNQQHLIHRIKVVWMVGFRPFEYSTNTFRVDILHWLRAQNPNFDTFIFGNYFQLNPSQYPSCHWLMERSRRDASICLERADYPEKSMLDPNLPYFPKGLPFRFVDVVQLHCAYDKAGCMSEFEGVPFMYDWNHTNATFVRGMFADVLINNRAELEKLGVTTYFNTPRH